DGGAVLGYGTNDGGQMPLVTANGTSPGEWITDPDTGEPAISRIDENELRTVAADLGLEYRHRIDDSSLADLTGGVDLTESSSDGRRDILSYEGFYWIAALVLAVLLGWEAWSIVREIPKQSWMRESGAPAGVAQRRTPGGVPEGPPAAAAHLVGESREM